MPSVRPKLVEIGKPIAAFVDDENDDGNNNNNDHTMGGTDNGSSIKNSFVIGGGVSPSASTPVASSSLGTASHTTIGGGGRTETNTKTNNSITNVNPKRSSLGSSLARASKGTMIGGGDESKKRTSLTSASSKRPSHSFVIGGGGGGGESGATPLQHDNNNYNSCSLMMMDQESESHTAPAPQPQHRTSITATSFQIPGNVILTNAIHTNSSSEGMDVDPAPAAAAAATNFVVAQASSSQAPSYESHQQHSTLTQHQRYEIHDTNNTDDNDDEVDKMEGVIDLSEKAPMVVLDGANIAYAYDKAWQMGGSSSLVASQKRPEPDARGIVVACNYFLAAGIRVLAVCPATMLHRDPHQKILRPLTEKGVLVPAPPRDDDDAYAITIARREDAKSLQRGDGPGYVMSNDQFRDAMQREELEEAEASSTLRAWLTEGTFRENGKTGPGRISYTFCDTGSMDDHGDKILDMVANPRHPLVQFIEKQPH